MLGTVEVAAPGLIFQDNNMFSSWAKTWVTDPFSYVVSSAAINGFAKVGLIPFTKKVLVEAVFGAATLFASNMKKEGPGGQRITPTPMALTSDECEGIVADIKYDTRFR